MILGEPPRTQGDLHFALLGIPVRIHPLFWLVTILLGPYDKAPILSVMWLAAVLVSITIHELGHAAVMRSFGFRPWIVLHGFGGLAGYNPGDPLGQRPSPWGDMFISMAGPAAGFLTAALVVVGLLLAGHGGQIFFYGPFGLNVVPGVFLQGHSHLTIFLNYLLQVCVFWGLINLLPVYPLDGGQIAQQILTLANPHSALRQSLMLSVLTAGVLACVSLIRLNSWYMAIFFGYLAYSSYMMLQATNSRGQWQ